ncbi:MAG: type II toxin-antitoxin system VapC family toxin [Dehalococcoidia bacterium]
MTRYLLDTDTIVDYLKGISSTIAVIQQLGQQGHQLYTCAVVECEVASGLGPQQRAQAEQLLDAFEYLPASREAARKAGGWRGAFRSKGVQLATTDCLIAAMAVAHGAVIVTGNVRDFPMSELTLQPLPRVQGGSPR